MVGRRVCGLSLPCSESCLNQDLQGCSGRRLLSESRIIADLSDFADLVCLEW